MQRPFRGSVQFLPGLMFLLFPLLGLGVGQGRFASELGRPFQRRPGSVGPNAFEIGMSVGRARHLPRSLTLREDRSYRKQRQRADTHNVPVSHTLTSDRAYRDLLRKMWCTVVV